MFLFLELKNRVLNTYLIRIWDRKKQENQYSLYNGYNPIYLTEITEQTKNKLINFEQDSLYFEYILNLFESNNFDINKKQDQDGSTVFFMICLYAPEHIPLFLDYGADPYIDICDITSYAKDSTIKPTIFEKIKTLNNNSHAIIKSTLNQRQLNSIHLD